MMRKLIQILTVWSLFFSQISFALDIQIERALTVRQPATNGLSAVAQLPKGSVISIPDEYVAKHLKGKKQTEMAITNWLRNGGTLKKFIARDGSIKRDYYFPVKVVSTPNGTVNPGLEGQVALRYLAKSNDLTLKTVADTILYEKDSRKQSEPKENCSTCHLKETPAPVNATSFASLTNKLEDIFDKIDKDVERKVEVKKYPSVYIENFNATCGMKFTDFLNVLKVESLTHGIPPEILLGMMSAESDGRCDIVHSDGKNSYSVGLFQINTNTTKLSFKDLKDPIKNLREAIRVLTAKYQAVNGTKPKSKMAVKLMSEKEKTLWRKALSAYNGGEGHVFQSFNDLKNYSKRYKAELDPEDWQDRKVFYFRKYIEQNTPVKFTNSHKYKRSKDNAISNIVYVESIIDGANGSGSLIDSWYPELLKIATIEENKKQEEEQKRIEEEKKKAEEEARKEQERLEEEKRKAEEEAKRLEEEKRKAEEEAKKEAERIAEEKRKAEEEAKRLEEEKRKAEEEAKRLEEEKRKAEEQARLEEEKRKAEEAKRKAEEEAKRKAEEEARKKAEAEREAALKKAIEEAKRQEELAKQKAEQEAKDKAALEEAKRKAEEERKKAEEEAKRKAEEERKKAEEEAKRKAAEKAAQDKAEKDAFNGFILQQESEKQKADAEFKKQKESYEKKLVEVFQEYVQAQNELESIEKEEAENNKVITNITEVVTINKSQPPKLDLTSKNVWRTTILGIAKLKYEYRFRNPNPKYAQKCVIYVKSIYNQVDDVDKHTIIVQPGQYKEISGYLRKPWVGQGAKVEQDCYYVAP